MFSYRGIATGEDRVLIYADLDANSAINAGEPQTTALVRWTERRSLSASIVRGVNNAAGASVYTVALRVVGATSGASYEFVVPSGHVPEPLPLDPTTHRYAKIAVNGEVVWTYTLVAPRGVFNAQVFAVGAITPISSVEVK